jgi:hypothetical protein
MTEEQMKKLSDEDLQHVANNQLDKMSDAGLEVLAQGPGKAPEPAPGQDTSGSLAKSFNDMEKGFASGALNEGSFNYVPPNYFPNNSPVATDLGRVVGGLVSGAYVGKAVSKIPGLAKLLYGADPYKEAAAPFMQKAARAGGRVAFNSGLAGAMGLAQNPRPGETRSENALTNALFGGALSTTAEVVPELSRYLGRKIGGLNAQEAEAFRANPEKSKALYKMMSEGGADQMNKNLQTMFKGPRIPGGYGEGGLQSRLQAQVIDPAKEAKRLLLSGDASGVRVNMSDFENSSPEVKAALLDMMARNQPGASARTVKTPIDFNQSFEGDVSQLGLPLNTKQVVPGQSLNIPSVLNTYDVEQLGLPLTQRPTLPIEGHSYPRPPNIKVESGQRILSGGFEEQLPLPLNEQSQLKFAPINSETAYGRVTQQEQLGLPLSQRETVSGQAPQQPKTVILTKTQADRLGAIAGKSAYARAQAQRLNPIAVDPYHAADANVSSSLRAGVENQTGISRNKFTNKPQTVADLNSQIDEALNYKGTVDDLGANLQPLLTSDGKMEAIRSYYDRNTGSRLNRTANQLEAGRKLYGDRQMSLMNIPSLLSLVGGQPLSRGLIRTPVLPKNATGMSALQAIIRGTRGAVPPSDEQ